ncbi:MAG: hypothetical protein ABI321_09750 [Polyangia bacterium]
MKTTLASLFEHYLQRCSAELFAEYGVELTPHDGESPGSVSDGVAGVIGFAGENIKGSLLLGTTSAVVRSTYPVSTANGAEPGSSALVDWTSELSNQLLGRLKNRLLLHDVSFIMSTPVSLAGDHLRHPKLASANQRSVSLRAPTGIVVVSIEAEVDAGLEFRAEPMQQCDVGVAGEGDVLLF